MITAAVVRTMLLVDMIGMALLALFFLRHRRMDWMSYCWWGLLAIAVPVLGPFVVIAKRPGQWDPEFSVTNDIKQLAAWVKRLLPEENPPKRKKAKTTLADRVRRRKQARGR